MPKPSEDDLTRLRESSNLIEKLIIIRRFRYLDSASVIHPILEAVSKGDQEIINEAAVTLFHLKKHITHTIKTEITNENCFIRWVIVLVIKQLEDDTYIKYLIPALGCGYKPIIDLILETLKILEPTRFPKDNLKLVLNELTENEKERVGHYSVRNLGILSMDITETLFSLNILKILDWSHKITPLLKVKHHNDYRVRQQAQKILKVIEMEEIFNECIRTIENKVYYGENYDFILFERENYPLHCYAIEGLALIGKESIKARKILWGIMRNGTKIEKFFSLKALEKLNRNSSNKNYLSKEIRIEINRLLQSLEGKNKLIAIQTLGKLGEDWATSEISNFLKDSNPNIKLAVLESLSNSKQNNILDKVAFLLVDQDRRIRKATVRLFEKLDPNYFQMQTNEGNIIEKLPKATRDALLDRLVEGLKSNNQNYQIFAAFWLGTLCYLPALEPLLMSLETDSNKVLLSIITALGIFGSAKAIPKLKKIINKKYNENIRKKAIEVIGMLGEDTEGIYALISQLYLNNENEFPELTTYISSFGARIIPIISLEIEKEKDIQRKILLQNFLKDISKNYEIKNIKDFKILL